uniref:EOG090X0G73 n=1 Tax=Alona affinis TaxID=381656 RepID=A0A9N6WPH8_9CRUS|nr:EOG090X0G73 [Alona affinis]
MESCYVPNNPNFASVDQWTPPSPTSPPVSADASSSSAGKQQQEQQQQGSSSFVQHHHHHHDSVIQQLCCDSDDLIEASGSEPPSHSLTSLSALPPVQELLGPCRNPSSDGNSKDRAVDPFSSYSLTALDFEPLPGFLTLSSCASYAKDRQHQDMSELPFKSSGGSSSVGTSYGYPSSHSPQQHLQGPMSPFSAAVAAATQQQQQHHHHHQQQHNPGQLIQQQQQQCQTYSFHGPSSSGSNGKMALHHHHHHHHQSTSTYQDGNGYGTPSGTCPNGLFPSMSASINVSMNMTMGMGMSMGPMSYGLETAAPLQCWNGHNGPSIHHLPGVAAAAAAAAAASVNPNNSTYPPAQALLSPIQVSYNSNIYPTSFTPSSAAGYCLPGDWRQATESSAGLYELKELKDAHSPFGGKTYNSQAGSKPKGHHQQTSNGCGQQYGEAYPTAGSSSPVATVKKRSSANKHHHQHHQEVSSLSSSIDYDGDGQSCGSSSSMGSGLASGGKANLCRVCGKTYARPSTLKTHMRTHSGERPYRCGDCHKSFSQAANLTAHVRTHSGEKPFRCQICDRRFSQSSSVTTHMRTHSGERPYRCRMCKKAFSDSSTLTKHMRIHSGEKPYQCKLCLLRFSQSGNLNRHMRVHSATS